MIGGLHSFIYRLTPSEGGRAGTILTDEIKRSAVTETPSNLIETYNKANESYRNRI